MRLLLSPWLLAMLMPVVLAFFGIHTWKRRTAFIGLGIAASWLISQVGFLVMAALWPLYAKLGIGIGSSSYVPGSLMPLGYWINLAFAYVINIGGTYGTLRAIRPRFLDEREPEHAASVGSTASKSSGQFLGLRRPLRTRSIVIVVAVVVAVVSLKYESWAIEWKMASLCKLDGGQKIYEVVRLPPSYFNNLGHIRLGESMATGKPDHSRFTRIGDDEFRIVNETRYLVGERSVGYEHAETLTQQRTAVYRWSDKKLLGEEIGYHHGRSSRFSFGFQPGGSHCPQGTTGITALVFVKQ